MDFQTEDHRIIFEEAVRQIALETDVDERDVVGGVGAPITTAKAVSQGLQRRGLADDISFKISRRQVHRRLQDLVGDGLTMVDAGTSYVYYVEGTEWRVPAQYWPIPGEIRDLVDRYRYLITGDNAEQIDRRQESIERVLAVIWHRQDSGDRRGVPTSELKDVFSDELSDYGSERSWWTNLVREVLDEMDEVTESGHRWTVEVDL